VDQCESPLELLAHEEVRARVENELRQIQEPFRTVVLLRDIEGLSYEEIADVLQVSLGTVKSRLIRGRDALRKRLEVFVRQLGCDPGGVAGKSRKDCAGSPQQVKVEAVKQ
jgi:RNA polymerase sigma-70 factor (ECF subfamily)